MRDTHIREKYNNDICTRTSREFDHPPEIARMIEKAPLTNYKLITTD